MVMINAAFYAFLVFAVVMFAASPIRKEEKALWVTCFTSILLSQVPLLFPKMNGVVEVVQTALYSAAFLVALALLVSLWQESADKERGQE
jgi:purine-cytosine permease-like protein